MPRAFAGKERLQQIVDSIDRGITACAAYDTAEEESGPIAAGVQILQHLRRAKDFVQVIYADRHVKREVAVATPKSTAEQFRKAPSKAPKTGQEEATVDYTRLPERSLDWDGSKLRAMVMKVADDGRLTDEIARAKSHASFNKFVSHMATLVEDDFEFGCHETSDPIEDLVSWLSFISQRTENDHILNYDMLPTPPPDGEGTDAEFRKVLLDLDEDTFQVEICRAKTHEWFHDFIPTLGVPPDYVFGDAEGDPFDDMLHWLIYVACRNQNRASSSGGDKCLQQKENSGGPLEAAGEEKGGDNDKPFYQNENLQKAGEEAVAAEEAGNAVVADPAPTLAEADTVPAVEAVPEADPELAMKELHETACKGDPPTKRMPNSAHSELFAATKRRVSLEDAAQVAELGTILDTEVAAAASEEDEDEASKALREVKLWATQRAIEKATGQKRVPAPAPVPNHSGDHGSDAKEAETQIAKAQEAMAQAEQEQADLAAAAAAKCRAKTGSQSLHATFAAQAEAKEKAAALAAQAVEALKSSSSKPKSQQNLDALNKLNAFEKGKEIRARIAMAQKQAVEQADAKASTPKGKAQKAKGKNEQKQKKEQKEKKEKKEKASKAQKTDKKAAKAKEKATPRTKKGQK